MITRTEKTTTQQNGSLVETKKEVKKYFFGILIYKANYIYRQ